MATDTGGALRSHGFHSLRVKAVVEETSDASSFVLDIPPDLAAAFEYEAGQFCTFRVSIDGEDQLRSYSMSSTPAVDADLAVTVKRVPGGLVSNWFLDNVEAGDSLQVTRPAGVFCLQADRRGPVLAFCGGSGVTPVISIAKKALTGTDRPVRILYANRGPDSVIFGQQFRELQESYPDRLTVTHHLDSESGYLTPAEVTGFAVGSADPDVYICGPELFMDLVEAALLAGGTDPAAIFIERFGDGGPPPPPAEEEAPAAGDQVPESVTIVMKGKKTTVPYQRGDTLLETARRGGLKPPFSCESGTCATCMAILHEGTVHMRVNHALTPEELDEGWVLTCQSLPTSATLTVEYEAL